MNLSNPLVSVIMPVYNTQEYLHHSVRSCMGQSYANIELVAVNDGSSDSSLAILHELAAEDGRVRVFSTENRGVVAARNRALAEAQGEFVYFLDSDDSLLPDAIERLVHRATEGNAKGDTKIDVDGGAEEGTEVDMVLAGLILLNGDQRSELHRSLSTELTRRSLLREMLLYKFPGSLYPILFRRRLFDGITPPEDLRIGEDFYAICRILLEHNPVFAVDHEARHEYVQSRTGSAMNTRNERMARQQLYLSECVGQTLDNHTNVLTEVAAEAAYFHLHNLLVYVDKMPSRPDMKVVRKLIAQHLCAARPYLSSGMRLKLQALRLSYTAYRFVTHLLVLKSGQ